MNIPYSELRDLFKYNPDTGELFWNKTVNSRAKKGKAIDNISPNGYIQFQYKGKKYYAHRVIYYMCYGEFPEEFIDHIDGNRANNKRDNLRQVSKLDNHKNMKKPITNTSGIIGVCWREDRKRWVAQIKVEQKAINLGHFAEFSDAVNARKNAEVLYGFHENHGRD